MNINTIWNVAKKNRYEFSRKTEREKHSEYCYQTYSTSIYMFGKMVSFVNWNIGMCAREHIASWSIQSNLNIDRTRKISFPIFVWINKIRKSSNHIHSHQSFTERVHVSTALSLTWCERSVRVADKWTGCETLKLSLNDTIDASILHAIALKYTELRK